MKKKLVYAVITVAVAVCAFVGGNTTAKMETESKTEISIESIKGWEHWETENEVGIELQTENGTYTITKKPYTPGPCNVTVEMEN